MVKAHSGARWEAWTCGRCVLVQDLTSDLLLAHMSELVEHLFAVCPAAEALPCSLDRISDPPTPHHIQPRPSPYEQMEIPASGWKLCSSTFS